MMGSVKKITMMLVGAFAAFAMSGGLVLGANYEWAGGTTTDDNWEWALPSADDAGAVADALSSLG